MLASRGFSCHHAAMSAWTDFDKDMVRTLWARGVKSHDIVPRLSPGITRNAVMGMLNRMGLMGLGHADEARLLAITKVEEIMDEEFFLGAPLHREALLALRVGSTDRSVEALALATGVCRDHCAAFLDRLPMVWPRGKPMPLAWQGSLEGTLAFILDMAYLNGVLDEVPVRRDPPQPPRLAA